MAVATEYYPETAVDLSWSTKPLYEAAKEEAIFWHVITVVRHNLVPRGIMYRENPQTLADEFKIDVAQIDGYRLGTEDQTWSRKRPPIYSHIEIPDIEGASPKGCTNNDEKHGPSIRYCKPMSEAVDSDPNGQTAERCGSEEAPSTGRERQERVLEVFTTLVRDNEKGLIGRRAAMCDITTTQVT